MKQFYVERMGKVWYRELVEARSEEEAKELYAGDADWEKGFEWTNEYYVEEA